MLRFLLSTDAVLVLECPINLRLAIDEIVLRNVWRLKSRDAEVENA